MSQLASAPFDSPSADLILRSSDQVEFRVHRVIMEMTSSFFEDILSLPQPPVSGKRQSGPPLIPFGEDSTTLDHLLRFCYPEWFAIPIRELDVLMKVVTAADKYHFDRLVHHLQSTYLQLGQNKIREQPLEVFVFACRLKWGDVARASARATLFLSFDEVIHQAASVDAFNFGFEYSKLLEYYSKCRKATEASIFFSAKEATHFQTARVGIQVKGPLRVVQDAGLEMESRWAAQVRGSMRKALQQGYNEEVRPNHHDDVVVAELEGILSFPRRLGQSVDTFIEEVPRFTPV